MAEGLRLPLVYALAEIKQCVKLDRIAAGWQGYSEISFQLPRPIINLRGIRKTLKMRGARHLAIAIASQIIFIQYSCRRWLLSASATKNNFLPKGRHKTLSRARNMRSQAIFLQKMPIFICNFQAIE